MAEDVVFLIDVDNTLLDNDQVIADLKHFIEREIGAAGAARYWEIFNLMRTELGYVDYLGALQRYRVEVENRNDVRGNELQLLPRIASFLLDYPFAERLYVHAFEALHHLSNFGQTVILTDGDVALQAHKIKRSGLWDAVGARVLIYIHKEKMLGAIERQYPARHYVLIDDKPSILAAVKALWQARVTTVLPMQGHYALDVQSRTSYAAPDKVINEIGALASMNLAGIALPAILTKSVETIPEIS